MNRLNKTENFVSLYEDLRNQVMKASYSNSRLGLGLFIQRGMAVWMKCWPETVKEERTEEEVHVGKTEDYPCPLSSRDEIVNVLVNMVLGHREVESHA